MDVNAEEKRRGTDKLSYVEWVSAVKDRAVSLPAGKTLMKFDYPQQGAPLGTYSDPLVRRITNGDLGYIETAYKKDGETIAIFVRLADGRVADVRVDNLLAISTKKGVLDIDISTVTPDY